MTIFKTIQGTILESSIAAVIKISPTVQIKIINSDPS